MYYLIFNMEYKVYAENKISFIEVKNIYGLKVVFTSAGAGIKDIYYKDDKITDNATTEAEYLKSENIYGKTLSLNLKDEDFEFDGLVYHLDSKMGLNRLLFSGKPFFNNNSFLVQYLFKGKAVRGGLPGNIKYYVTYAMNDECNKLMIEYRATSDKKTLLKMHHIFRFNNSSASLNNEKELKLGNYLIRIIGDQKFINEDRCYLSVIEDNQPQKSFSLLKRITYEIVKAK